MFDPSWWPWTLGALALALPTLVHQAATGKVTGVSSLYARMIGWADEAEAAATEARTADRSEAELAQLLEAETAAMVATLDPDELGISEAEFAAMLAECDTEATPPAAPEATDRPCPPAAARVHPLVHLVFLVAMVGGGALAAVASGRWGLRFTLSDAYTRLVADGAAGLGLLFLGGAMVGLGTRMAGGCSTGHGLQGTAALQPGSLVSTITFFGTAVAVSTILGVLP